MKRIAIFGNLGGGKSTLADRLGEVLGAPVVHLDARHSQSHWDSLGQEEAEFEHDQILLQDEWIIDGFGSWWMIERRLAAADTTILIDLPPSQHVDRALRRQFRARNDSHTGLDQPPDSARNPWARLAEACRLIRKIRSVGRHTLPRLRALLAGAAPDVHHIRLPSQHAIDAFLRECARRAHSDGDPGRTPAAEPPPVLLQSAER